MLIEKSEHMPCAASAIDGVRRLKLFIFCLLLIAINSALPSVCLAANHYIRDGGIGDGSDWVNAWDDLPASLIRGDTYYVADGDYKGYLFNDAEDGEKYIYVKKAIESDHGDPCGWSSAYGDGVANWVMDSDDGQYKMQFNYGYYVFDGQVGGGPGSWTAGHGFKLYLNHVSDDYRALFLFGDGWSDAKNPHNITIKHVDVSFPNRRDGDTLNSLRTGVKWDAPHKAFDACNNYTISYCYFHQGGAYYLLIDNVQNWVIEYNYFSDNWCDPKDSNQGEGILAYGGGNVTVRYNIFRNINGTANIGLKKNNDHDHIDWAIYGNVFWHTDDFEFAGTGGNGVIGDTGSQGPTSKTNDIKIYNNTIVGIRGENVGFYFRAPVETKDNVAYNNVWYNCEGRGTSNLFTGVDDHDYNWYYDMVLRSVEKASVLASAENHGQLGTGDPFEDWANEDFSLSTATNDAFDLGSPYDTDWTGATRGADGVWERGAYEYISLDPNNPKIDSLETRFKNVIDIWFDRPLDESLIEDPNNYTINYTVDAAEDSIVVHNVSSDPNLNRARLFTSTHSEDVEYTLKADFIQDKTYTSNLVGDWRFDEYSSLEAKDSSCKGNTATLVNGPAWTGQGDLSFDGNDDAVEVPTADLSPDHGTITLWAYAEDLNGVHYLFSHLDQDDNSAIQLYTIGAQLCLSLGAKLPDYVALNIESLVPQAWYNIALTWDGTNYTVYVDGIAKISGPYDGLTAMNTFADVGNDGNNRLNAFNGIIDNVKIYNLALTADAISDLFFSEEVKENKSLAFVVSPMDGLTYSVQNQQELPAGAVFDPNGNNTFAWKPWYDQAGGCEVTFEGVDGSKNVQDTLTITAVVEDIELSSWYEQWLRHLGLV